MSGMLQRQWSRLQYILALMVQNLQELQRVGGFGSEAPRIPTMFQFRPTTRTFSVFVYVCVIDIDWWNGTMLDQVVTMEFSPHLL